MHPILAPSESARRFSFGDSDCLYRDHRGRRVVADIEGLGFATVEVAECRLLPFRDQRDDGEFLLEFKQSLTVLADSPGLSRIAIVVGRTHPASGNIVSVDLPFSGAGWVSESVNPVQIDGRHEIAPAAATQLQLPFFRELQGSGSAKVILCRSTSSRLIDSFEIGDRHALKERAFACHNAGRLTDLDSTFSDGSAMAHEVMSHLNAASWQVEVPSNCAGLILRKTYDRFHGRQRARVLVDGSFIGWWYESTQDRASRWHEIDFGISGDFFSGKSSVKITIDPPPGTPLWSVAKMEVFGMFPTSV